MARDKTDQSALTPARNTRSQTRLTQQGTSVQPPLQFPAPGPADETSFNMMITSETFLLDTNESFAAQMMAGNSIGDVTLAAPRPQSPKRRGRRTPSPDKPPKAFNFLPRESVYESGVTEEGQEEPPTQQSAVSGKGKAPSRSSQPFPTTAGPAQSPTSASEPTEGIPTPTSSTASGATVDTATKSGPRRKSLIARPVSTRNPLSSSTATSNAWLHRKPSQNLQPSSLNSSPPVSQVDSPNPVDPASAQLSKSATSEQNETPSETSDPKFPTFRKIVKLKRTGLTRVSRSSGVPESQVASDDVPQSTPPTSAQLSDKGPKTTSSMASSVSPTPNSAPTGPTHQVAPASEGLAPAQTPAASLDAKAAVSPSPPAPTSQPPKPEVTVPQPPATVEPVSEANPSPKAPADVSQEMSLVEPPPRVAAHVPKPLPVMAMKPKRPRPVAKDDVEPPKLPGSAQTPKTEEESKPKRVKFEHPPKPDPPKPVAKPATTVGRGLPSSGPVRLASRAVSSKSGRTFSAPTAASTKRVPLGDRGHQRSASNNTKADKVTKEATVPHAFTFESDRRLDFKKATQQAKEKHKPVLQHFKPVHHPATLDKPTAASLSRALATVTLSENQPPAGGKAASKKASTLQTNAKFQPTVPQAPKFATDERMKDRSAFDEALRRKEEERLKAEEAEREAEEKRKEQEVKELRKLLDETARANVHPVPEWYKERPKLKKEGDGAGVSS